MKKLVKIAATLLAALTAVSCVACGPTSGGVIKNPNTLNISVFEGGYGTEVIEQIAEGFKAENPGTDFHIEKNGEMDIDRILES